MQFCVHMQKTKVSHLMNIWRQTEDSMRTGVAITWISGRNSEVGYTQEHGNSDGRLTHALRTCVHSWPEELERREPRTRATSKQSA
jgi:hypothetical protein